MSTPLKPKKRAFIWKFAMSAEALIQIACKNDEIRVFFSQIFFVFYNKKIIRRRSIIIRRSYLLTRNVKMIC